MNSNRNGNFMQTLTGKLFYPIDPRPWEIFIGDIAGALGKLCRYGGHCTRFYSVAEHSIYLSHAAKPEHKLTALLHDASEAYLVDIPRPIKPFLSNYEEIEARLMRAISYRLNIIWPLPKEIKILDNAILGTERNQIMVELPKSLGITDEAWGITEPPLDIKINCWGPDEATERFLAEFYALEGRHYG